MISAFLVSVGFPEECEIHASMSLLSGISEAMQYDHGTGSLLFVRIKEAEASFSFTVFGAQLPRSLAQVYVRNVLDQGRLI